MSLKKVITEAVVIDSMYDIEEQLLNIKETILEQMIIEGVDDPGILKCVFMAGGPGSGKSFTAMEIFGIDKKLKSSFSSFGLKSVNSDTEFEFLLKKYGFETFGTGKLDIDKWPEEVFDAIAGGDEDSETMTVRKKAKLMTKARKEKYMEGRLGMIIDGTGHDLGKIKRKTFDISLEEINDMKTQINLLREFKIRAVTIFSVVQFIMTVLLFWKNIT